MDKKMQGHVTEVMAEYTKDTLDMEKKLNETIKAIPMSEFRRALENLQDAARKKLAARAMFWNYTLAKSPLEKHLAAVIDARASELGRRYTGAALLRLSAAAAKSKTDFLAGLKALRPRDYLKEAVASAISKKPPKVGALDYKAGPDKLCMPRHIRGSCVPRHIRAILFDSRNEPRGSHSVGTT